MYRETNYTAWLRLSRKKKWKGFDTIISLTFPREDNSLHKVNSEILFGIMKRGYMDYLDGYISDNENI